MGKYQLFEKKYWLHALFFIVAAALTVYFVPEKTHKALSYEIGKPWDGPALFAADRMAVQLDAKTEQAKKDSILREFVPFFKHDAHAGSEELAKLEKAAMIGVPPSVKKAIQHVYEVGIVENSVYDSIRKGKLPIIQIRTDDSARTIKKPTSKLFSARKAYEYIEAAGGTMFHVSSVNYADFIRPNYTKDNDYNKKYLESAYRSACVRPPIEKGERIIDRGEIVTPQKAMAIRSYEQLEKDRIESEGAGYPIVGFAIAIAGLFFLLYIHLSYYRRESIFNNKRNLLFILLLLVGLTAVAYSFMPRLTYGEYIMPVTLLPVIVVTFFDSRTAFFLSVVQVLLCSLIAGHPLEFIVMHLSASIVAIDTLQELSKRSQLIRTAIFVLTTYAIAYTALCIIETGYIGNIDFRVFLYFAGNAVLLSFAYIVIFVFERLFGFVSKVTLVELSDVNNPLLQELSEKCPGTFQHSVQVSNLASEAAKEIGANYQLTRAGALYHDIGKMENPAFFTENQHDVNPHELISPEQSAKIVIRHVTDGVRLAEKSKLPGIIKNFILEHHGKNLAKYFYTTACNNNGGEPVDPDPYTYPGPNPRSKETAILMMADATEAASRSLKEYNDETITALVNKIIDGQIAQGLMKDSPLSFRDVEVVKKVFISRLRTMFHTRIAYPELKKKEGMPEPQK